MMVLPNALQPILLSSEIIPRYADTMGHVKSAKLSLEGSYRIVNVTHEHSFGARNPYGQYPGKYDNYVFEMEDLVPKHLNQHLRPSIDHLLWFEEKTTGATSSVPLRLACLALCASESKPFNILHCLLLYEPQGENKQHYQRCGLLNIRLYDHNMLEKGWKRRTFVII